MSLDLSPYRKIYDLLFDLLDTTNKIFLNCFRYVLQCLSFLHGVSSIQHHVALRGETLIFQKSILYLSLLRGKMTLERKILNIVYLNIYSRSAGSSASFEPIYQRLERGFLCEIALLYIFKNDTYLILN